MEKLNNNSVVTITVDGEKITGPIWLLGKISYYCSEGADSLFKYGITNLAHEGYKISGDIYKELNTLIRR